MPRGLPSPEESFRQWLSPKVAPMAQGKAWAADCAAFVGRHFCTIASGIAVLAIPILGYLYQQEIQTDREIAESLAGLQSDMRLVMFRLDNPAIRQNASTIPAHAKPE